MSSKRVVCLHVSLEAALALEQFCFLHSRNGNESRHYAVRPIPANQTLHGDDQLTATGPSVTFTSLGSVSLNGLQTLGERCHALDPFKLQVCLIESETRKSFELLV